MISVPMTEAINQQIQLEIASAYTYLAMSAYFEAESLPGFAHWMLAQHHEEMGHAMRLFSFLRDRGGRIVLGAIPAPAAQYGTPQAVMQETLEHERRVTLAIHGLYAKALAENDFATQIALQWFVSEQVEEEANVAKIIDQLKLAGDHPTGIMMIDQQLASRALSAESAPGTGAE